jgi:hypothetical protein
LQTENQLWSVLHSNIVVILVNILCEKRVPF